MSGLLRLDRELISNNLRPCLVLEIEVESGEYKDITPRFLNSIMGEDVFLDTDKSYAVLYCELAKRFYPTGTPVDIKVFLENLFRCVFDNRPMDHWSTNIGNKTNFRVNSADPAGWAWVFSSLVTVVFSDNPEKLYGSCPWLGTQSSSHLAKVCLEKYISLVAPTENSARCVSGSFSSKDSYARLEAAKAVLRDDWYVESPPLVVPMSGVEDAVIAYLPIRTLGKKNYWGIYNKEDLSLLEVLCGYYAIIELLETGLHDRMKSSSVWRWLKDLTQIHPDGSYVECRGSRVLDEAYPVTEAGMLIKHSSSVKAHQCLRALKSLFSQREDLSPLIKPLKNKVLALVDMVYMRDRAVNGPRKSLQESLNIAKSSVRWKGSIKAGERVLRDVIVCLEEDILKSPKNYKEVLRSSPVSLTPGERGGGYIADEPMDLEKADKACRLGSTSGYRFIVYLCYLIKVSNSRVEGIKIPPSIGLALGGRIEYSHDLLLNSCEDRYLANDLNGALECVEALVRDYKDAEHRSRIGGLDSYEVPLLVSTSTDGGMSSASYPVTVFGASSLAEYLHKRLKSLEASHPEQVNELRSIMREHMRELQEEHGESLLRTVFKARYLRELALPESW